MEYLINDREPVKLFHYFEDICAIPHGSGNEKEIASYVCEFAEHHGLEYYRDLLNNVLIIKNATTGYENKPAIMLQGHMDMVCEKNIDTNHDFVHDPLELYVIDGCLKARGTTLGGDDGIAIAIMLAILSDDSLVHPRLECLFTVQEETGLDGAKGFDYKKITAKRLINLDSEDEGVAIVGCAGGMRLVFKHNYDTVPAENKSIKIEITGLAGGHSGCDINLGRANAIKLMGRVLLSIYNDEPFNLLEIRGGSKTNAIPRECEAIIASLDADSIKTKVYEIEHTIKRELSTADQGFRLRVSKAKSEKKMLTYRDTGRLISLLTLVPYGVRTMSPKMPGLVESSVNPGVLQMKNGVIELYCSARSSVESIMDTMELEFGELSKVLGIILEEGGRYPGWEYVADSALQHDFIETYNKLFGDDSKPQICAIHAGLECGIIIGALGGDVDTIAIGPNIYDIHTPNEKLELDSVEKIWNLVCELLKK